jgi:hypothetical protein
VNTPLIHRLEILKFQTLASSRPLVTISNLASKTAQDQDTNRQLPNKYEGNHHGNLDQYQPHVAGRPAFG